MRQKIGIVDYNTSNIANVIRAIKYCNADFKLITKHTDLKNITKLILPGVGSFVEASNFLNKKKLNDAIINFVTKGNYIMGLCLGMQLLLTSSEEFKNIKGLNLIKGKVKKINQKNKVVPNTGWSKITNTKKNYLKINKGDSFYFTHSFKCNIDSKINTGYIKYLDENICAFFVLNNMTGIQFHPELSGQKGLNVYKRFINLK